MRDTLSNVFRVQERNVRLPCDHQTPPYGGFQDCGNTAEYLVASSTRVSTGAILSAGRGSFVVNTSPNVSAKTQRSSRSSAGYRVQSRQEKRLYARSFGWLR